MASTYTDLGTELMTTGENAGNWGTKTNVNLQILEEAVRGYVAISANSDQTLSLTDGSTGDSIRNAVIAFTGTLSANRTITVPALEKWWIMDNQTAGAYTLTVKVSGQTGITWGASDKGTKILYGNGTDVVDTNVGGGVGGYDLNGEELILDADANTSITADTDNQIDIKIAGADDFTMTANAFNVLTGSHVTFADSANAKFGTGNDMLLYHDGSNSYITNAQGALKIATETSGIAVTIGHTTSETTIADNLTVTGTLTGTLATAAQGSVTSLGTLTTLTVDNIIVNGTTIGHTSDTDLLTLTSGVATVAGELDATTLDISGNADIDGTTNLDAVDIDGAVQIDATFTSGVDGQGYDTKFFGDTSSAYMLWDTSADDLVFAGAAGIDLAGDIDVDGTANLDVVDIDGAVQIDNTVTVGVDDTGYDVKFFGDTASAYMLWDTSADDLILAGAARIVVPDSGLVLGSTAVTTTAAEINLIDGGASTGTTAVADADGILTNDNGTMRLTTAATFKTYFQSGVTASSIAADDIAAGDGAVTLSTTSGNITVDATANNSDIIFKGTDATSDITMLTLDGSEAGAATFNDKVIATELDISGNMDIDGTSNLDAVDIDGAVQLDSTFTVGVDDTGYDVKFFGATASAYMLWDESTDDLILAGAAKLYLYDAGGGEHISSDGSTLSIAGGGEIDLTATAIDINGTCDISGTFSLAGTNVTATAAELNYSDLATLGTSAASKVLSADANNLTKITGGVYLEEDTLSFDATQDWDVRASPVAQVTLTANVTFDAPSNPTTGQYISILCIQDGTGSRTIAWNAVFEFTGGTAPTATTTAGKGDLFTFRYHNSHWIEVGRNLNLTRA